jgi:hypothetical protein
MSACVRPTRDDPRYFDLHYWAASDPGQSYTDARREQMAAVEARATEFWLDGRAWPTPLSTDAREERAEARHQRGPRELQNLDVLSILVEKPHRAIWDRDVFAELVPPRPYCTDRLGDGLRVRPRATALQRRYIQLNGPAAYAWLQFDVDRPGAFEMIEFGGHVPLPTIITVNPATTHAHVGYLLFEPVTRFAGSRESPLHYLAAVERGLRRRLGADRAYNGLITQNPLHPDWRTDWLGGYSLSALAASLRRADMRPEPRREHEAGLGRNCSVFDDTREWAYREVLRFKRDGGTPEGWRERCRTIAGAHNSVFALPLPHSEVRSIGKSIADWTWDEFTDAKFSRIQSLRAQRRWAGHVAESSTRPWEALGISERTYYRRKRAGQL